MAGQAPGGSVHGLALILSALATIGGLGGLAALLKVFFDWRSLRVHYRQSINEKMIDRVSQLAERHYLHVSSSAVRLCAFLKNGLPLEHSGGDRSYERGIFYSLAVYLHHANELAKERPRPLFKELEAEERYMRAIAKVYDGVPFGFYEVSRLVDYLAQGDGGLPPHKFVDLIEQEQGLKELFEGFYSWLSRCRCGENPDPLCEVHNVIDDCATIGTILVQQIRMLYSEWYGALARPAAATEGGL